MTKQEALKQMNEAINEMARMTEGSAMYNAAKEKHDKAKGALIAIMSAKESEEVEAAESELAEIIETVEARKNDLVADAGVNTNSIIAGISSGSISVQTEEETKRIYELKKFLMTSGVLLQQAARNRNLARVKARNQR